MDYSILDNYSWPEIINNLDKGQYPEHGKLAILIGHSGKNCRVMILSAQADNKIKVYHPIGGSFVVNKERLVFDDYPARIESETVTIGLDGI